MFGLTFAQDLPAPQLDRLLGLVVGTARRLGNRAAAQAVRVQPGG